MFVFIDENRRNEIFIIKTKHQNLTETNLKLGDDMNKFKMLVMKDFDFWFHCKILRLKGFDKIIYTYYLINSNKSQNHVIHYIKHDSDGYQTCEI